MHPLLQAAQASRRMLRAAAAADSVDVGITVATSSAAECAAVLRTVSTAVTSDSYPKQLTSAGAK